MALTLRVFATRPGLLMIPEARDQKKKKIPEARKKRNKYYDRAITSESYVESYAQSYVLEKSYVLIESSYIIEKSYVLIESSYIIEKSYVLERKSLG
jgi:hypothetical protein